MLVPYTSLLIISLYILNMNMNLDFGKVLRFERTISMYSMCDGYHWVTKFKKVGDAH
jgi:hypothetical protein